MKDEADIQAIREWANLAVLGPDDEGNDTVDLEDGISHVMSLLRALDAKTDEIAIASKQFSKHQAEWWDKEERLEAELAQRDKQIAGLEQWAINLAITSDYEEIKAERDTLRAALNAAPSQQTYAFAMPGEYDRWYNGPRKEALGE